MDSLRENEEPEALASFKEVDALETLLNEDLKKALEDVGLDTPQMIKLLGLADTRKNLLFLAHHTIVVANKVERQKKRRDDSEQFDTNKRPKGTAGVGSKADSDARTSVSI